MHTNEAPPEIDCRHWLTIDQGLCDVDAVHWLTHDATLAANGCQQSDADLADEEV